MADADADTDAKSLDQDALVAGIDRTRAELARTIDAISDRVSPKKNVDRALEQVRKRAGWWPVPPPRPSSSASPPCSSGAAASASRRKR